MLGNTRLFGAFRVALCGIEATSTQAARLRWASNSQRRWAHAMPANDVVADHNESTNEVDVKWADGKTHSFSSIWLRDHCQCSTCYHSSTKQRLLDTYSIPLDIKPGMVDVNNNSLSVIWPDGHLTVLGLDTLKDIATPKERMTKKILWGSEIAKNPPEVTYEEVMSNDDAGLKKWMTLTRDYGFSFVTGVPATTKATQEVCERMAPMKETWFGKLWDFTSNMEHADTAYTNLELKCHTDSTYVTDPPGLQVLHCLSFKGTGGDSLLVDGFTAANQLKEKNPNAYNLLKNVRLPQQYTDLDKGLYYFNETLTISEDHKTGELTHIRFNTADRAPLCSTYVDQKLIPQLYQALHDFEGLLRSPANEYRYMLTPGRLLVFDNWRVLHGRLGYTGARRLCGCYIDRDAYKSNLRAKGVSI